MTYTARQVLIALALRFHGNWNDIFDCLKGKTMPPQEYLDKAEEWEAHAITILDNDYPEGLKQTPQPPFVLFTIGDTSLLSLGKKIAIDGAPIENAQGKSEVEKIVNALAEKDDVAVIAPHCGGSTHVSRAVEKKGRNVIAVVPSLKHKPERFGVVVSEIVENDSGSNTYWAIAMNRVRQISASLCSSLVITETRPRGGAVITIAHALNQGKDIYCTPTRMGEDYENNALIAQGANILVDPRDLLQ